VATTDKPSSGAPRHETDARDARIGGIDATGRPSLPEGAASSGLIAIHPLAPDERGILVSIHARLGAQSRRQRYLAPKGPLSEHDLDLLGAVDGHNHVALVASAGGRAEPVGVARYVRHSDTHIAETAVEVVDEWQRRGVGRLLMTRLRMHAVRRGVRRFEWTAFESNGAVAALARDLSEVKTRRIGAGVTQWSAAITGLAVDPRMRLTVPRPVIYFEDGSAAVRLRAAW
jgi:GNAT superfamily N-acetyltransferase